jgi:hypothetical protein
LEYHELYPDPPLALGRKPDDDGDEGEDDDEGDEDDEDDADDDEESQ